MAAIARVEIPAPGDLVIDTAGNVLSGRTVTLKLAGTATVATHYSALTGGTSTTGGLQTWTDGTIRDGSGNRRYVTSGQALDLTIAGVTRQIEPLSASVETRVAATETGKVAGAATTEDWYGDYWTAGNAPGSVGFAGTPTAAPATTVGSGGVTLPLSNATCPITDCAQLSANGGSFTLGGNVVAYSGRSAASGAGNATGCYTLPSATGTYASGTALGFTSIGFGALVIYEKFGLSTPNAPVPGTTQAGYVVANYHGPTVDDSAEAFSAGVFVKDTGTPFAQHKPITGFEAIAQIEGGNTALDGAGAALIAGGGRTNVSGVTSHVKDVIGWKLSHNSSGGPFGFTDNYHGYYQTSSALASYTTLNGAATLPQATIPVVSGAAMPPATAANPVTVLIGANADGVGGQQVTYTGISTNDLTGCTGGTGTIATGSRVTNIARGVEVRDPISSTSALLLGDSGWSGSVIAALRGGTDADKAMLAITAPTNADLTGGAVALRLNAGSGAAAGIMKAYDTSGTLRFSVSSTGSVIVSGQSFIAQTSGVNNVIIGQSEGSVQPGTSVARGGSNALGAKINSGTGAPTYAATVGDLFFRTDTPTVANQRVYICTVGTGTWVGIA